MLNIKQLLIIAALSVFSLPGHALEIDLGVASNYNAFVFSSLNANGGSSGALAVGASSSLNGFSASGGVSDASNGLDFATAYTQLSGLSQSVASLQSSGTTTSQWGGLYFSGSGNTVEVFNIEASDLAAGFYSFANIASGATVVINVSGTLTSSLKSFSPQGHQVLLNFQDATSLSINGAGVNAAILAPEAAVSIQNASFNGNLVAQSLTVSGASLNTTAFQPVSVSPVPEPATWAMLLGGLGLIGSMVRRRL